LQEMFQRKKEEVGSVKLKVDDKHAQFQMVSKRDSAILPAAGYAYGWINRTQKRSDATGRGKEWRSEAYVPLLFFYRDDFLTC